jgi:UDP-N-acetylglucosamine 2-epimerase
MQRSRFGVVEVAATRPSFKKVAPLPRELRVRQQVEVLPLSSGQRADATRSDPLILFRDIRVVRPDASPEASR